MLTILNDPSGISGVSRIPLDYSISLQANIERHLSGGADAELRINGLVVDPLTDPRLDIPPSRFDLVTISLRPRGWETLAYIVIAALVAYAVASGQRPAFDESAGKDSPNNKLTGQRNVARAYQAIPDVYGHRRVWPDLIQPSTVEYIDHLKYVTEWMCVSRGLGTISDVRYAETPITDIDGSSWAAFAPAYSAGSYPEHGVTTLTNVYESFESAEVNGQEIPYADAFPEVERIGTYTAVSTSSTFTVSIPDGAYLSQLKGISPGGTARVQFTRTDGTQFTQTCTVLGYTVAAGTATFSFSSTPYSFPTTSWPANESGAATFKITPDGVTTNTLGPYTLPVECDRIWWDIVFLRGLKGSVQFRSEWWQIDASGAEVPGTRQTRDDTLSANTFDQRFWTLKATPTAGRGRYRFQITRLNVQVNDQGADVAKLEEVRAVRYYATKELPGVTVIRVTTKATLAATGFSDRKFNLRWTRHVRELYSDELSPSRNFARTLAHIWAISGNQMSELDIDALEAINAAHGETSPLLRFDGSLDDADMSLGERMAYVADTARCILWRDGTKWTVWRDEATPYPEMQLDYRNLAAGGDSRITYSAHLPATHDGVELEYVDEAGQSKKAYVRLNISSGAPVVGISANPKRLKLLACTTEAQAVNRARLEARKLIYQRVTVSDRALSDAAVLRRGSLVRWIDPNDFGGDGLQAGEVLTINGATITTSEPLQWGGATSGRMTFTGIDGRRLGAPVVCFPGQGGSVILDTVPTGLFTPSPARQCGSRYAFATGLTDAEMESASLYTVTEVRPSASGTVDLSLASYDTRIYSDD